MRTVLCVLAVVGCFFIDSAAPCYDNQFECETGECIPDWWWCDDYEDCPNGDDEACHTGTSTSACRDDDYECETGECIPDWWWCDGDEDCTNGDDEIGCPTGTTTKKPCREDQYTCLNGDCIPPWWLCDGYESCPDGDDEDECSTTVGYTTDLTQSCPDNFYQCQYNGECIPGIWVCDYDENCPVYGDDEIGCPTTPNASITTTAPECGGTFEYIYDRCVLVNPFTSNIWDEARYMCEMLNSELVVLDDYNFFAELLQYIIQKGLDTHNYWVGASDENREGNWVWVDGSPVPSGGILWALYGCNGDYQVEPRPSDAEAQDCGFLDKDRGLYMSDGACDETFSVICQNNGATNNTMA